MEDLPKHDTKKKNTKAMPLAISIGGGTGSLGMGGIVLFGGALVTATIVSAALAFKIRRSSKKSRSPSSETQSVDAPDQLEFMVKTNKDLPLDSQNQSDGATSMKEIMQTKTIQDSSRVEKQNCDEKVESEGGNMFAVVGEDEESYVNSVSEMVMSAPIVDGGDEQKKYCNEDNQQTDNEEEEYKAIEGVGESMQVGALVSDEEMPTGHVGEEDDERTAAMVAAGVNGVKEEKEKDCEDEMINVANGDQGELTSDETGYAADGVVSETEEAINTVFCVRVENQETQCKLVIREEACLDIEITIQAQEMHQSRTFSSGSAVDDDDDDRAAVREDNPPPPNQLMMMNKEEQGKDEDKECEIQNAHGSPTQFVNKDKEAPDVEAEVMMITEEKSRVEDDDENLLIPPQSHAQSDVTTAKTQVGMWPDESVQQEEEEEANTGSHMIEEIMKELDDTILVAGKGKKDDQHKGSKSFTHRHSRFAKGTFLYNSCYSELLPFPEISLVLVPTLLLIFILLALGTALQRYLLK